jgi:hypothetical protein
VTGGVAQTETQSIETVASVEAAVEMLADPTRVPEWAPAFADRVCADADSGWRAVKDGREFRLRVPVSLEAGKVDYLREIAQGREGGAYIRAVPRPGDGAVTTMTLPLLPNVDPEDTRATLRQELATLVSLIEDA